MTATPVGPRQGTLGVATRNAKASIEYVTWRRRPAQELKHGGGQSPPVAILHVLEQLGQELLPERPRRCRSRARRQHVPWDAALLHEDDARQWSVVVPGRSPASA